ncbi:DUF413 domain-containing protein [Alteromonas sp. ASW11-19]|uniref:Macrodomain Ori protein n=1 Tax=Alteromonas salexigens TaxID=2982530 RepID=A0ABT2VLF0_9ALTE|nr:DUF413 domain-containing protein [Alteromonas salexigens]MCU7553273.1 DUF413 domain-containing protein [Alteromonas salexigens]
MSKLTRDSLVTRQFSDPKHYPYGFSRSGDFSISESKLLQQYGSLIAALVDGKLAPETEDDHGYLAAAFGQREPRNPVERVWVKYQHRINRPKMASIHGFSKPITTEDDDVEMQETGVEIDIDTD